MMRRDICCILLFLLLLLAGGCGTPEKNEKTPYRFGKRTYTSDQWMQKHTSLWADSNGAKKGFRSFVALHVLADTPCVNDSIVDLFSSRMRLRIGEGWTSGPARMLFCAGVGVGELIQDGYDSTMIEQAIDSIWNEVHRREGRSAAASHADLPLIDSTGGTAVWRDRVRACRWLQGIFGIERDAAHLLYDFLLFPGQHGVAAAESSSVAEARAMVRGLVFDSTKAVRKKQKMLAHRKRRNSALALRLRPQTSIRDSIERHLINIKVVYNKHLKASPQMRGRVVLNFEVVPGGQVRTVEVHSSQIANKAFLRDLREYADRIRFLPIDPGVGNMTFNFPFDFTPQ